MKNPIITLSGPPGSGITECTKILLKRYPELTRVVSSRTQPPSLVELEKKSQTYIFYPKNIFQAKMAANKFVEVDEFGGHLCGTEEEFLEKIWQDKKIPVAVISPKGVAQIRKKYQSVISVVLMPRELNGYLERIRRMHRNLPKSLLAIRLTVAEFLFGRFKQSIEDGSNLFDVALFAGDGEVKVLSQRLVDSVDRFISQSTNHLREKNHAKK